MTIWAVPALRQAAVARGWKVLVETLVPDEKRDIQSSHPASKINKGCHVVLTTGGTAWPCATFTPEAVLEIATRELPGFGEAMRMESMKITHNAILSRTWPRWWTNRW